MKFNMTKAILNIYFSNPYLPLTPPKKLKRSDKFILNMTVDSLTNIQKIFCNLQLFCSTWNNIKTLYPLMRMNAFLRTKIKWRNIPLSYSSTKKEVVFSKGRFSCTRKIFFYEKLLFDLIFLWQNSVF